jgi:hypothetical protein
VVRAVITVYHRFRRRILGWEALEMECTAAMGDTVDILLWVGLVGMAVSGRWVIQMTPMVLADEWSLELKVD